MADNKGIEDKWGPIVFNYKLNGKEENFPLTFSYFCHHLHLYISSITISVDLRSFASGSLTLSKRRFAKLTRLKMKIIEHDTMT